MEERKHDQFGNEWIERWETTPPALDVAYQVIDDEWNADGTVRTIRKIKVA